MTGSARHRAPHLLAIALAAAPLLALGVRAAGGGLSANPIEDVTHVTGEWSLRLLLLTLAVTPARRWLGWAWLAPLRLVLPWKYGFKSIKSIVKIRLTERQPPTSWNISAPGEYGFYANVNPAVDHPRWSQKRERRIGEFLKRDTLPFNGYGEQVAQLYSELDLRKFF